MLPAKASEILPVFPSHCPLSNVQHQHMLLKWKSNNVTMFYCLPDIAYPLSMS